MWERTLVANIEIRVWAEILAIQPKLILVNDQQENRSCFKRNAPGFGSVCYLFIILYKVHRNPASYSYQYWTAITLRTKIISSINPVTLLCYILTPDYCSCLIPWLLSVITHKPHMEFLRQNSVCSLFRRNQMVKGVEFRDLRPHSCCSSQ